jgi:O-antigen/teichoic acid export membrane protein
VTEGVPARRSLSAETLVNMAVAAMSGIGAQLVVLAITPFLIWTIGLERYGFWALCSSISRYGMLTDVLFAPIITMVASAKRADDLARVRRIATFATLFYLGLVAVFVPLAAIAGGLLLKLFPMSPDLARDAPRFFTGYVAYFFVSVAVTGLGSVLNGLGLLRKTATINAIGTLLYAATAIVLALRGFGLWALLDALVVQVTFSAVALYALCRGQLGHVFVSPPRVGRELAIELLTFGGWVQLSTFATLLGGETDQILIGAFVGIPAVGLYEVGAKLARAIRSLASFPNNALLPSIAALATDPKAERVPQIVVRASRLVSVVTIFAAALLVGGSTSIVTVWLGHVDGVAIAATVLVVLAFNNLLETIVSVPVTAMRAMRKPKLEAFATGVGATINLAITIALVRPFGIYGVLAGTLGGTFAAFAIFYALFARAQHVSLATALFAWIVPLAVAGAVTAATFHFVFAGLGGLDASKTLGIVRLVAAATCAAAAYVLVVRVLHVFAPGELRRTLTSAGSRA